MNPDSPRTPREEIEIRMTALLMGELPPTEAAPLQAQIKGDAELAVLFGRLQRAAGLLREASAIPEQSAAPEPARLSDERRTRLLAHFKGEAKPKAVIVKPRRDWKWAVPLGLAASLMALIGGAMYVNGFTVRKVSLLTEVPDFSATDSDGSAALEWYERKLDGKRRSSDVRGLGIADGTQPQASVPAFHADSSWDTPSVQSQLAGDARVNSYRAGLAGSQPAAGDPREYSGKNGSRGPTGSGTLYLPGADGAFAGYATNGAAVVPQEKSGGLAGAGSRSVSFGGVISNPEPASAPLPAPAQKLASGGASGFLSFEKDGAKQDDFAVKGISAGGSAPKIPVAAGTTFYGNGGSNVVLGSSIIGTGGVAKSGSNSLNVSGAVSGANSFSGGTVVAGGILRVGDPVAGTGIASSSASAALDGKTAAESSVPGSEAAREQVNASRYMLTGRSSSPKLNLFGRPGVTATSAPSGKNDQPPAAAAEDLSKLTVAKPMSGPAVPDAKKKIELSEELKAEVPGSRISGNSDAKEVARYSVEAFSDRNEPQIARNAGGAASFPMTPATPTTPSTFSPQEPVRLEPKVVEFEGFVNSGKDKPAGSAAQPNVAVTGDIALPRLGTLGGRVVTWKDDESSKVKVDSVGTSAPVKTPATTSLGLVSDAMRDGLAKENKPRTREGSESTVAIANGTTDFGTVSGIVRGRAPAAGATLSKTGGGTWEMRGANTFSGTTSVNAGTMLFSENGKGGDAGNSLAYTGSGMTEEKVPSVVTKSGQRANVAEGRNFNFRADFDAPEMPQIPVAKDSGAVTKTGDGTLNLNRTATAGGGDVSGVTRAVGDLGVADEKSRDPDKQNASRHHWGMEQAKKPLDEAKGDRNLERSEKLERELGEVAKRKTDRADAERKQVEEQMIGEVKLLADIPVTGKLFQEGVSKSQSGPAVEAKVRAKNYDAQKAAKEVEVEKLNEAEKTVPKPAPNPLVPQPEIRTGDNAFSTFSLNVSDVAFKLAAASLEHGTMPDVSTLRSEEFINAFDYRDPEPAAGVPLAFVSERARYPFAQNRDLVRFSVKTASAGRQPGRPLNIVLLLDNSGSMERADRVRILREGLRVLSAQLQPQDKLSIVTFARAPRLWADGVAGDKAGEVTARVGEITPEGGTNLSAALDLGYATALKHYQPGSINHVVVLTDGAANLGDVNPAALKQKVEAHRKQGIALDCFGVGWEGLNDDMLEQLSRNGDGRYGFINTPEEAAANFAGQLAGALRVAASDVKVQVEWNPKRVTAYRQVGYAKHQLTKEQFRDNTVDAAEIGAAESGNALYVVEVDPRGSGDLATVRVRFKVPGTSDYREHEWIVPFSGNAAPLERSSSTLRLAGTAAAFSEMLASSPFAAEVTSDRLLSLLNGVPVAYGADPRPKKLEWMIRQAKSISGR